MIGSGSPPAGTGLAVDLSVKGVVDGAVGLNLFGRNFLATGVLLRPKGRDLAGAGALVVVEVV